MRGSDRHNHTCTVQLKMKSVFLLDAIGAQGASIIKLLTSKEKALMVQWNAFCSLNLLLDILNRVSWINLKSNGLNKGGFDKNHFIIIK